MFTIADYDKRYRPYDKAGRELVNPSFVKLPINPKGDGLRTLLKYKRGGEVFCIWCLLLEKTTAEKQPDNRGKLLNHKGEPASVAEIAEGISHDRRIPLVKYALSVLVTMGWVRCGQNEDIVSSECGPNITKVKLSEEKYNPNSDEFVCASLLLTEIKKRKPDFKEPNLQEWSLHIDRMIRIDGRSPGRIKEIIEWCQQDSGNDNWAGWQNNILSTAKLRKQFDKLEMAAGKNKPKTTSSSPPAQQAVCICRKPAKTYRQSENRKRIDLCGDCDKAARLMGSFVNRPIDFIELERIIERGKAKMQERSTPKPKDPELAQADKQQVAIRKLVKETADNFGKG